MISRISNHPVWVTLVMVSIMIVFSVSTPAPLWAKVTTVSVMLVCMIFLLFFGRVGSALPRIIRITRVTSENMMVYVAIGFVLIVANVVVGVALVDGTNNKVLVIIAGVVLAIFAGVDTSGKVIIAGAVAIILLFVLSGLSSTPVGQTLTADSQAKAQKIDAYFELRSMPLKGQGTKMVTEAEKNGIDWRLLPAIAIRESSGGKRACGNNPFGWGVYTNVCPANNFASVNEAIEVVARNLGGNNPNTAKKYRGSTQEKLYSYNGTVVPNYPAEVMKIMEKIEG